MWRRIDDQDQRRHGVQQGNLQLFEKEGRVLAVEMLRQSDDVDDRGSVHGGLDVGRCFSCSAAMCFCEYHTLDVVDAETVRLYRVESRPCLSLTHDRRHHAHTHAANAAPFCRHAGGCTLLFCTSAPPQLSRTLRGHSRRHHQHTRPTLLRAHGDCSHMVFARNAAAAKSHFATFFAIRRQNRPILHCEPDR